VIPIERSGAAAFCRLGIIEANQVRGDNPPALELRRFETAGLA
jgi:hypothetical protein